jgi:hypothetical protein
MKKRMSGVLKSQDKNLLEEVEKKLIKKGFLAIIRPKNKQYILYC